MYFNYKNTKVHYCILHSKDPQNSSWVIFLHGWGGSIESFRFMAEALNVNSLLIDFPPFGKSDEPENFDIYSYADMVYCLCKALNINEATFICHSFGGRVGIILASIYKSLVLKLILIDSAGIKPKRKIKYYFKVYKYKLAKKLNIKVKNYGSSDFKTLSKNMQKTFINIVNTNLERNLKEINAKTLIIFGKNDRDTPVYMAKKLHKNIKNSKLYLINNAGHFSYIDKYYEVNKILKDFLEEL